MKQKNSTLLRQLKRLELNADETPSLAQWNDFLETISRTYDQNEGDRYLQERALEISSSEMREAINREKELGVQIAQAARLSSIGTLASGVAHELNNPLGGVLGYAELMLLENNLVEADQKRVTRIVALVQRMSGIVKHLLKLAHKPEAMNREVVNLVDIVRDSLELAKAQMELDGVGITVELEQKTILVAADAHRLTSVLQNLVNNARDEFLRPRDIALKNPMLHIYLDESQATPTQICLCVKDNAGGIPKEIIDKIFDPFFTTKEVGKGTGLGLSLSRRIMAEFGGRLTVGSQNGETEFRILIPRHEEQRDSVSSIATHLTADKLPRLPGQKKKILVVDDELDILTVLEQILVSTFIVVTASSASEALEVLKTGTIDILVTDLKMPDISGDTLIEQARGLYPQLGTVLISGHAIAAEASLLRLTEKGVVLIEKPFPPQARLIELIHSSIEKPVKVAA